MVRSVDVDARGIVAPDRGLTRFRLDRFPPGPGTARFIDRYWVVTWDLRDGRPHTQHVFAHPVVNVTFGGDPDGDPGGLVTGVTTRLTSRTLAGQGRVLGVMFRPAGFRPLLRRPMRALRDRECPLGDVLGPVARDVAAAVATAAAGGDAAAMAAAADDAFAALLPVRTHRCEATTALVEGAAGDPVACRVERLAAAAGCTTRQLQRRFADHVGIGPKAVLRRYRLFEAAERARSGCHVDWSAVAADLGYSDQAHLTRDFSASFGVPPGRYLQLNRT